MKFWLKNFPKLWSWDLIKLRRYHAIRRFHWGPSDLYHGSFYNLYSWTSVFYFHQHSVHVLASSDQFDNSWFCNETTNEESKLLWSNQVIILIFRIIMTWSSLFMVMIHVEKYWGEYLLIKQTCMVFVKGQCRRLPTNYILICIDKKRPRIQCSHLVLIKHITL